MHDSMRGDEVVGHMERLKTWRIEYTRTRVDIM